MSFYFFSDIGHLKPQINNSFGPSDNISEQGIDYEQYLTTSMHTATEAIDAIAVCKGQIFIQEQSENGNLLNIIFKPTDIPPFNFPNVQYFIYKGIRKDSLIAANNIDLVPKNTNELIDSIWKAFESSNSDGSPSKSILGLDSSVTLLSDMTSIENVFLTSFDKVQIWNVLPGMVLGKFDQDNIGFEIIINSQDYVPILKLTRNSKTVLKCKALSTGFLQKDFFQHWHVKEDVINFIDPCAYFASFYNDSLKVFHLGQEIVLKKDSLYTELLDKFLNKNIAYIDIRNEFNSSLNFFKNYGVSDVDNGTNLKIKKGDESAFVAVDYYKNRWPILTFDSSGFDSTSAEYQTVTLQLPDGRGDNPTPLIFFSKAYMPDDNFPKEFEKWDMFKSLSVKSNFTDGFKIGLPWKSDELLSSYTQLKYLKQFGEESLPPILPTQIRKVDYMDALFSIAMNFDYLNSSYKTKVFDEHIYADVRMKKNYDAVFSLSISFDSANVTLTANPVIINNCDSQRKILSIVNEHKSIGVSANYLEDISVNKEGANILNMILTLNGDDFNVLQVKPAYNDLAEKLNIPDFRKTLGFTLTKEEWENVVQVSSNSGFEQNYPIYIMVTNKQNLEDDRDIDYTSMDLSLAGFIIDGNNIKVQQVLTNINLFTYGTF